jgi:hypothetical protein
MLDLNAIAIDVHPPRASRTAKRLRRWIPRRSYFQARDRIVSELKRTSEQMLGEYRIPLPEREVAPRLIVPGWAHIHGGLAFRGGAFLGVYLLLGILGLLNWGTDLGAICLGLAFSVHASAVLDILVRQGSVRFPAMVATSILVAAALTIFPYAPAGWLLSGVATTRQFDYDAPPFARLDVMLFNRWTFAWRAPRPGDVVLFHPGTERVIPTNYQIPHIRWLIRENECIDRVLGGPGDRVHWKDGKLSINGVAVPWTPLIPERFRRELTITVPRDRYLILPSTSRVALDGIPDEQWVWLGCFPAEEILGQVYLRLNPLRRLWLIR